ncbi:hypothetical protein CON35_23085 [Bacillus cereus]|nr:hypothetical protein CON35_23085 [Bacillus cereus]
MEKKKTYTRHRQQIRSIFGFRTLTKQDNECLKQWLNEQVHFTHYTDYLEMKSHIQFRNWKIEPPSVGSLTRMIASAIDTYENNLYQITSQQLSPTTCFRLDALLEASIHSEDDAHIMEESDEILTLRYLLASPGKPSVTTMNEEVKKLVAIRHLQITDHAFKQMAPKLVQKYRLRTATETITKLHAHPTRIRYTLLSLLFWCRKNLFEIFLIKLPHLPIGNFVCYFQVFVHNFSKVCGNFPTKKKFVPQSSVSVTRRTCEVQIV